MLKAKKLTAVANAKLTVIEQSIQQEEGKSVAQSDAELSERDGKLNNSERTSAWVYDQRHETIRHRKGPEQDETIQLDRDVIFGRKSKATDNYIVPQLKDDSLGKNRTEREAEMLMVQQSVEIIAATNQQLAASLVRQSLPKCHPDTFSGDVTMFHPWKNSFEAMIRDADISLE